MYEYRCKILKVVDGDTVDVDIDLGFDVVLSNQRIRLYGVDTPESRTKDLTEKRFGLMAKHFVEEQLPVGSFQTLKTRKDATGKFGRILGEFPIEYEYEKVTIKSTVNEQLIKNHLAVAYFGQSKEAILEQHLKNRTFFKEEEDMIPDTSDQGC